MASTAPASTASSVLGTRKSMTIRPIISETGTSSSRKAPRTWVSDSGTLPLATLSSIKPANNGSAPHAAQ